MNINNIIKAAVPEGRNARIISSCGPNYRDPGFLSKDFPRSAPKLYVTAESDDFDELTLAEWRDEGYDVEYIPMGSGGDSYVEKLRGLSRKKMGPCEAFGIVGRQTSRPSSFTDVEAPAADDDSKHMATPRRCASSTTTSWTTIPSSSSAY